MDIGERIKNRRLQMGLTQEELADRSDLTKGFISQLERDQTSPSVDTLENIVNALGLSMADFFLEVEEEPVVYRKEDAIVSEYGNLGSRMAWLISNAQAREMESVVVEIDSEGATKHYPPFEGEIFGYVLDGSVKLHYGETTYRIKKKDSFYFEADEPFYIENTNKNVARVLWVATPPTF